MSPRFAEAIRTTRGIADNDEASSELPAKNDAAFTIFLARVLELNGRAFEHQNGIVEVQAPMRKRSRALDRIDR